MNEASLLSTLGPRAHHSNPQAPGAPLGLALWSQGCPRPSLSLHHGMGSTQRPTVPPAPQVPVWPGDSPAPTLCQQYIHVFLNEVTVLVPVLNETKHSFALYTPERTRQRWPVHLAAATEQDMNDWVSGHEGRAGLQGQRSRGCPASACRPPPSQR